MSKVRVQDATKELSASVSQLYDSVSKAHKRAVEMLNSLRKQQEAARQKADAEAAARKAQEDAKLREAAAALTGGAYSAEPPAAAEAKSCAIMLSDRFPKP